MFDAKIGDIVYTGFKDSPSAILKSSIIRETSKFWVLENNCRIRKKDGVLFTPPPCSCREYGWWVQLANPELDLEWEVTVAKKAEDQRIRKVRQYCDVALEILSDQLVAYNLTEDQMRNIILIVMNHTDELGEFDDAD